METTTRSVRLNRGKGLFITVSVLIVIFGILEGYQRIRNYLKWMKHNETPYTIRYETARGLPLTDKGGSIVLVHHPHLIYRFKENQERPEATINAQGFRGKDWVMEGQSSCRVIVLGGSAAFGQGASRDDKVFTSVLERLLNASSNSMEGGVQVLNAAVTGYDSTQELILLVTRLLDYQPDVVVIVDGWNDLYFGGSPPQGVKHPVSTIFDEFDSVLSRNTQRWANILRLSAFFRMLERRFSKVWQEGGHPRRFGRYSDNLRVYRPRYRKNLERMARLAKAYAVEVIIAPQPELFQRKGEIPEEEHELRLKFNTEHHAGYADFARAQYPAFIEAAKEVAQAEGTAFVDTTTTFDQFDGVAFADFVHLNDQGHEILARHLLPIVARVLARKASEVGCNASSVHS